MAALAKSGRIAEHEKGRSSAWYGRELTGRRYKESFMSLLSAPEELRLSEAVAVYFRLLQFDRAWTEMTLRPDLARDLTREDAEILGGIAGELGQLILSTVEAAYVVVTAAEVSQPPDQVGPEAELLPEVEAAYNSVVEAAGGVIPLARQAYEDLSGMADEERSRLDAQREAVLGGGTVAGDLSRRFMCKFAKALMVAGGVSVWVPPHIHAGASVAAGVSIATANRCWELEPFFRRLNPAR
jgi:hypothetical protein